MSTPLLAELTGLSSFASNHPLREILDLLRRELDVPLITLWKIKYGSKTICAKSRSSDSYSPDPYNKSNWTEYVCDIQGHAYLAIFSKEFQSYQPFSINDISALPPDHYFNTPKRMTEIGTNSFVSIPIRSWKSRMRGTNDLEERPSYMLNIYFPIGRNYEHLDKNYYYLFKAISNRISTTNSSKIEKSQLEIGNSFNALNRAIPTLSTSNIFDYVLHDLLPEQITFQKGMVLWRAPGSHKFKIVSIYPTSSMTFHLGMANIDELSSYLRENVKATKIFDRKELAEIGFSSLERFNSLICAPLAPRLGEEEPNGYLILADKYSPFAHEVREGAIVKDFFDWEDTLILDAVGETVGLVTELLNTDQRRKQLADQIAHEMLIPATTIFQDAELLFEEIDNPEEFDRRKRDRWLENIVQYSNLQMRLCDGILNSLKDDGTPAVDKYRPGDRKVNLHKVGTDIKYMVYPWCRKARVRNDGIVINRDLPFLMIDRTAVEQVFLNLISNSIKYSNRDYNSFSVNLSYEHVSSVSIPGELGESYRKEFSQERRCQTGHLISVVDNGIGIADGCDDKVFEKHFRAPGAELVEARGSGLGLSIVKRIVDDHFGCCWVENSRNPTTLCVFFPDLLNDRGYLSHPRWTGDEPNA